MRHDYDLISIGSGPAGQKAAIQSAKLGARVAVVDRGTMLGGVCINTGTIPSKSLREAVIAATGADRRSPFSGGSGLRAGSAITMDDLMRKGRIVIEREADVVAHQLSRNHVDFHRGMATFVDPHTIEITGEDGDARRISSARFVIATGTRPARPQGIAFDERTIFD